MFIGALALVCLSRSSNCPGAMQSNLQTYVRLTKQARWLLLNFSGATMKEGIRRVVNDYRQPQATSASPRLRVNQLNGD